MQRRGFVMINSLCKSKQQSRRQASPVVTIGQASADSASVAMIYRSELDYISRCILDSKTIETGGQLFGFWTSTGIPVVLYAIGPGPHANHQCTFFNQDVDYLVKVGKMLLQRYGLQHIGEWHSHHQLGLAHLITAKPKAHAFKNEMCFPLTKTKCELKKHPNSKFECFFNDFNRTKTSLFLPFPSKLIQDNLVCVLELQE